MAELIIISTLNGVLYGMLLFLMASGLTLIFSMMGVLNFAHASFYMLGAFLGFQISQWAGFIPALILAPLIAGGIGALIERYGLRTVHKHGHVAELLFTFGLAFIIEEVIQMIWGKLAVDYRIPSWLDFSAFTVYATNYPAYKTFMLLFSIAIFIGLIFLLTRTRAGLIIQASLTHPHMVGMLGHNVPRVFMMVFGLGTALAAIAGVIAGAAFVTQSNMAALLGPILFVVVVVGGLGSLWGAFVASLLIGLLQTFAIAFDWSLSKYFSHSPHYVAWILLLILYGGILFNMRSRRGVLIATGAGALFIALGWLTGHPLLSVVPTVSPYQPLPGTILNDAWTVTVAQIGPILPYLLLVLVLIFRPTGLFGTRDT